MYAPSIEEDTDLFTLGNYIVPGIRNCCCIAGRMSGLTFADRIDCDRGSVLIIALAITDIDIVTSAAVALYPIDSVGTTAVDERIVYGLTSGIRRAKGQLFWNMEARNAGWSDGAASTVLRGVSIRTSRCCALSPRGQRHINLMAGSNLNG